MKVFLAIVTNLPSILKVLSVLGSLVDHQMFKMWLKEMERGVGKLNDAKTDAEIDTALDDIHGAVLKLRPRVTKPD